jgi:hypothetical protein
MEYGHPSDSLGSSLANPTRNKAFTDSESMSLIVYLTNKPTLSIKFV